MNREREFFVRIYQMVSCLVLTATTVLGGCAGGPPLPTYPPMTDKESLATIADRQASVTSISSVCDLDLTDVQGQRVSLDGVLLAQPPGNVRLRAWKFGHAVFDLTLANGKGWVVLPDEGPAAGKMDIQRMPAQRVGDALDMLGASFFRTARPVGGDAVTLIAQGSALGRDDVTCEIDRLTLTPRRFVVGEEGEPLSSELLLDRYTPVVGVVWPMQMRLRSPSGEVVVSVREVELNGEVPAGAFTPPARAKALP